MRTYTQARTILPVLFTLSDRRVVAILASPGVGKGLSGQVCQAKGTIEVSKGEQTSVGRDPRTVELQLETGIEGDPESGPICFTHRTAHHWPRSGQLYP